VSTVLGIALLLPAQDVHLVVDYAAAVFRSLGRHASCGVWPDSWRQAGGVDAERPGWRYHGGPREQDITFASS
jgi:hypothetical protein